MSEENHQVHCEYVGVAQLRCMLQKELTDPSTEFGKGQQLERDRMLRILAEAPRVDLQEVVRCHACRFMNSSGALCKCTLFHTDTARDGFCYRGIPRCDA